MGQITVTAHKTVHGPVDRVRAALADYTGVRSRILTEHYGEYEVRTGGHGAGTQVHWKLAATKKRVRDQLIDVTEIDSALIEKDQNSSMETTWTVAPAPDNQSTVEIRTTWNGAGGIGGFFERTFAPGGLRGIYDELLTNLDKSVSSD